MYIAELITRKTLPCWYELSFQKKKSSIVLRVHEDFIHVMPSVNQDAQIVRFMKKEFGFKNFVGDFNGNFGFDNAFIRKKDTKNNNGFVEFFVQTPPVIIEGVCSSCNGSGKDNFDEKCIFCGGTKKEHRYDYRKAFAISASFNVFFNLSCLSKSKTSSTLPQLLTVNVATSKGQHGGSLGGVLGTSLSFWLRELENKGIYEIQEVVDAMVLVHKALKGRIVPFSRHNFVAHIHDGGRIIFRCPGDACEIGVDYGHPFEESQPFHSHNVDTPFQQLILLAGLAALHDRVRKEMKA